MTALLDPQRVERVEALIVDAHHVLQSIVDSQILGQGKRLAAICSLFSGGNDSTIMTHLFRDTADYAVHCNTGIGIEDTRAFVRAVCAGWDLPLIEKHPPPGSTYEELVIERGFPGPAHHWKMYTRLKERALRAVRSQLVTQPYRERVVFLAGRRRDESNRRASVPETGRVGSIIWVSPMINWTSADLNTYRAMHPDVPRNEVSDLLHMSGECLCGAFAKKGELDEIGDWFPAMKDYIRDLERQVTEAGHPAEICTWGWGADRDRRVAAPAFKSGPLCSSCDPESRPETRPA